MKQHRSNSACLINTNLSALLPPGRDSHKQPSPLWNKKTGLRACRSRVAGDPAVVAAFCFSKNFEVSFGCEDIHAVPRRIVEKIVGLASDFSSCNLLPRIGIKDQHLRRFPYTNE